MTDTTATSARDKIRCVFVAAETGAVREGAEVLYEYAGKKLLSEPSKKGALKLAELFARDGAETAANAVLSETVKTAGAETGKSLTTAAGGTLVKTACKEGSKEITKAAAKESAKQVLKGVGRAAGLGGVVDGVFGAGEGLYKWANDEMSGGEACLHAAKEAGTGAAASAAGVAAAAGFVVLVGAPAAPVAAGVAVAAAIGAKLGLNRLFD